MRIFAHSTFLASIVLAFLTIGVFANHLQNPFQFDSIPHIQDNPWLNHPEDTLKPEFALGGYFSRGLLWFSLGINAVLGGLQTFGFHLMNLVFHGFNALLVYQVIRKAQVHFSESCESEPPGRQSLALLTAMIFLVHPIQTESVIYVISRSEVFSATFFLLGVYGFQRWLELGADRRRVRGIFLMAGVVLAGILGFGFKQSVATFPAILVLYWLCILPAESKPIKNLKRWWKGIALAGMVFLVALFWKLLSDESFLTGPSTAGLWIGRQNYMMSQPSVVIFYYLRLMLFPFNLNVDPDVPIVHTWYSLHLLIPLAVIILSFLISFRGFRNKIYFFFVCWFFIVVSPSSSIVTLYDLSAEHRVYLPFLGVAFIFSSAIMWLWKSNRGHRISTFLKSASVMVVVCLSVATADRNLVWSSTLKLWADATEKSPEKSRPYSNLGKAYYEIQEWDKAEALFKKSISLFSLFPEPHYNLGNLYLDQKKYGEAEAELKTVLQLNPDHTNAYFSLGSVYNQTGRYEKAVRQYRRSIEKQQAIGALDYPMARLNIGEVYGKQGRMRDALAEWEIALKHQPNMVQAHFNKGVAYAQLGDMVQAESAYRECLKHDPGFDKARFNLSYLYQATRQWVRSIRELETLLEVSGASAQAYFNLGWSHQNLEHWDRAREYYNKALAFDPGYNKARINLAGVYMQDGKYDPAIELFQEAVARDPGIHQLHRQLGTLLWQVRKDKPAALSHLKRALKLNPNQERADELVRLIEELSAS